MSWIRFKKWCKKRKEALIAGPIVGILLSIAYTQGGGDLTFMMQSVGWLDKIEPLAQNTIELAKIKVYWLFMILSTGLFITIDYIRDKVKGK